MLTPVVAEQALTSMGPAMPMAAAEQIPALALANWQKLCAAPAAKAMFGRLSIHQGFDNTIRNHEEGILEALSK